jgi:hypothetical protein
MPYMTKVSNAQEVLFGEFVLAKTQTDKLVKAQDLAISDEELQKIDEKT